MIDGQFKPWLIEINSNPCLELSCPLLADIIPCLVENTLQYFNLDSGYAWTQSSARQANSHKNGQGSKITPFFATNSHWFTTPLSNSDNPQVSSFVASYACRSSSSRVTRTRCSRTTGRHLTTDFYIVNKFIMIRKQFKE
jgi:hypothetical protein